MLLICGSCSTDRIFISILEKSTLLFSVLGRGGFEPGLLLLLLEECWMNLNDDDDGGDDGDDGDAALAS